MVYLPKLFPSARWQKSQFTIRHLRVSVQYIWMLNEIHTAATKI